MNTGQYAHQICSALFTTINEILLPRCYPEKGDALPEKTFNRLINDRFQTKTNEKWVPGSSQDALNSFGAVLEWSQSCTSG
jgi:hypothetical protein